MSALDALVEPYSTVLCDLWGVVHDGGRLLPGAAERLLAFKRAGKRVILVTNAPRPASTVQRDLDRIGLPREAYDAITSSGEAGIAALTDQPRAVGFLGTADDRADLIAHGVMLADEDYAELACTGLDEWRDDPAEYRAQLEGWAARGVLMHCLNPDRIVVHCGERLVCAGALADTYETLGGKVAWYGKPHAPIYAHALRLAGDPPLDEVLAIGDGLVTDMLGAARLGIAAIFVADGIHAGEQVPPDFAAQNGIAPWSPLLSVSDLR
jgi:HAD superfamily hydrolase (TIGR01459 family)